MAAASGLHWVPGAARCDAHHQLWHRRADSRGLDGGARKLILGLAAAPPTMAAWACCRPWACASSMQGAPLGDGGAELARLQRIDLDGLTRAWRRPSWRSPPMSTIRCAERVARPLCSAAERRQPSAGRAVDQALQRLGGGGGADPGRDHSRFPGVGAAGGLGFAARAFLRAFPAGHRIGRGSLRAGRGAVWRRSGDHRREAAWTRRACTARRRSGWRGAAAAAGVPVIALAGSLGEGYARPHEVGIAAAFSLAPGPISLAEALAGAAENCKRAPRNWRGCGAWLSRRGSPRRPVAARWAGRGA
jgi:glycerate kinase